MNTVSHENEGKGINIDDYKNEVVKALLALGGGEGDVRFASDDVIKNGIANARSPQDVALSLLRR